MAVKNTYSRTQLPPEYLFQTQWIFQTRVKVCIVAELVDAKSGKVVP